MSKWQTIRTVPRDGSVVLIWSKQRGIYAAWWALGGGWCVEFYELRMKPTHWMPLPKAPKE